MSLCAPSAPRTQPRTCSTPPTRSRTVPLYTSRLVHCGAGEGRTGRKKFMRSGCQDAANQFGKLSCGQLQQLRSIHALRCSGLDAQGALKRSGPSKGHGSRAQSLGLSEARYLCARPPSHTVLPHAPAFSRGPSDNPVRPPQRGSIQAMAPGVACPCAMPQPPQPGC